MSTEHSVTGWIAALKGGDEGAIEALVQRYNEKLIRYAGSVYRTRFDGVSRAVEDEEDAAQSALRVFWLKASSFRITDRNDLWKLLMTITIRKVFKQRQRALSRGSRNQLDLEDIDDFVTYLSDPEAAAELKDICAVAMDVLKPDLSRVAQMWLDDMPRAEMAAALGVSESAVYHRLQAIHEIWDRHFAELH